MTREKVEIEVATGAKTTLSAPVAIARKGN
jgi:hypothetical protein